MIKIQLSAMTQARVFRSAWFAKAARKAAIDDAELCSAIRQVMRGQAVSLGGGVYKKRLNSNRYRSIILARTARYWIYEYLFSKTSRDNIDDGELAGFRVLAQGYARLSESQLKEMLQCQSLLEICHDNQKT